MFSRIPCWTAILVLVWHGGLRPGRCAGGEVPPEAPDYWARTWQTDDGLPRNTITSIAQTPNGYLWLGTPFGLIRFDGVTFARMEGESHEGLARIRNRVLYTDVLGRLWIGTGTAGIIRRDGMEFTVIDSRNGLPHPTVTTICEDLTGTVWVGCQDGSLSWVDPLDRVHPVAPMRGERTSGAIQLVRDQQGILWFAQGNAYGQLHGGVAADVTLMPSTSVVLCPSRDGGMWLSAGATLQKLPAPDSDGVAESIPLPMEPTLMPVVVEDRKGVLWIGTQREGVFRYAGHEFTRAFNTSHRILSLFEDAESNLWVGTEGGGLSRLQPSIFHALTTREGLPQSGVRSVCQTANGDIWLSGQAPSVVKWTEAAGLERMPGFTNIGTTCVFPNPAGGVWVGTVNWGLFWVKGDRQERVGDRLTFRNRQIRAIHQDAQGQVWLGCLPDGLIRLSNGEMSLPQEFSQRGLPNDAIWSIADDRNGTLWLGTITGELWSYDGVRFSGYRKADGLPGASIGALHFTAEGDLWIGTLGGGLGRLRGGRLAFASVQHGLADDVISSIVEDGFGFFWLSSDRGIIRVRKRDLDEFAEGKRAHFESIRYGNNVGLANLECLAGYQPSAWRTPSGEIWFATTKGAVRVNPASLQTNPPAPPLVLEKVLLDNHDVTSQQELKFPYGYSRLDFSYTAPSFISPEQVHFRHQLVGLDADWMEAGTTRMASYPRLPPGHYAFRFTASNRQGAWNPRVVSVPFEITPAYWQTTWFRAATLLVFGGLVAGGVRYRYAQKMRRKLWALEQARAVEQERMRIARDIHDDLGARLTQMAFLSDLVANALGEQGKASERLSKLAESSREAIRSLDEIVWAVNPRKDTLPNFVDYLSHYANEFFRALPTRCRQNLPMIIPDLPLPTNLRHHLFLACKEALTNVSKHAEATEVQLQVRAAGTDLEIIIEDNGRGFRPDSSPANGNGLGNLNTRLAAVGGCCRVESEPGRGTRVRLGVRLPGAPAVDTKTRKPPTHSSGGPEPTPCPFESP